MALLSAWVLPPGPHRDWFTTFFLVGTQGILGFFLAAAVFTGEVLPKLAGDSSVTPIISLILFLLAMGSWFLTIAFSQQFLIPRQCPCCAKNTLYQSGLFVDRMRRRWRRQHNLTMLEWLVTKTHSGSRSFVAASVIGRCSWTTAEPGKVAPACGRTSLCYLHRTKNGVQYHRCSATLSSGVFAAARGPKQLLPDQWADAASPGDDCEYWLWYSVAWLKAQSDRIAKMARFRA